MELLAVKLELEQERRKNKSASEEAARAKQVAYEAASTAEKVSQSAEALLIDTQLKAQAVLEAERAKIDNEKLLIKEQARVQLAAAEEATANAAAEVKRAEEKATKAEVDLRALATEQVGHTNQAAVAALEEQRKEFLKEYHAAVQKQGEAFVMEKERLARIAEADAEARERNVELIRGQALKN